jgi:trans-aconitate 2-methyltransferase
MKEGERTWRWDAKDYSRNSAAQMGWALELIARLGLTGNETVLDIGCGDGKVTAEIARHVPHGSVLGVDSSEEMIRLARFSYPPVSNPTLSFHLADARALAFESCFDVAFSNATLHWIIDHHPVLAGVARALKPGGRLLFQMGGRGNGADVFSAADALIATDPWKVFFSGFQFPWGFYGPDEYAPWCRGAGLEPQRIELIPKTMAQKGVEGLMGWIRTTWMPYTDRLPEERREPFIREVAERYAAAHPPDAAGVLQVRMVRLEVEARKV